MTTSTDNLRVSYRLAWRPGEDPRAKAEDIALEQTVELPRACVPPEIARRVVGTIESLAQIDETSWRVTIAYAPETFGGEVPQLVNLLFGNISLKEGILLERVVWPAATLAGLPGPRFGVPELRRWCGAEAGRPLLCAALKPLGATPRELADRCRRFARGGIDLIKDDHGLADQPSAPFAERVQRCQEAVGQANAETGGSAVYMPNLPGTAGDLDERLETVRAAGCRGVLLSPMLIGLDTLRWIRERHELALLAHPSMTGAYFRPDHGIAPEVLLGQLFRLLGADAVIYPNVGGRFPLSAATCGAINSALREPLGPVAAAFPMPGGGVDVERVPHWIARYGNDTVFLIGASLYAQPDLERASRALLDATRGAAGLTGS